MSELALKLIAENKRTRATFLDLGNCGLTEEPDELGELIWLEELSFAAEWYDFELKRNIYSQNTGQTNQIVYKSSVNPLSKLINLKKLWGNGGYSIFNFSVLNKHLHLKQLDFSGALTSDLSPLSNLANLQWLNIANTHANDLQGFQTKLVTL